MELLKIQIRRTLRRTTRISKRRLELIDDGIENHWVSQIFVYAFDHNNLCRAELMVKIDWDEFGLQIYQGRAVIVIDERWESDTAIEVDEAIKLFNKFVETYSLKTRWEIEFTEWVQNDEVKYQEVLDILELTHSQPIQWASDDQEGIVLEIVELPELRVGCRLVIEDTHEN